MLTSVIVWPYKRIYFQSVKNKYFIICKKKSHYSYNTCFDPAQPAAPIKWKCIDSVTGRPTHHRFPHRPPALLPNLLIWNHNYRPRRRTRRFFQARAHKLQPVWAITCQNRSCEHRLALFAHRFVWRRGGIQYLHDAQRQEWRAAYWPRSSRCDLKGRRHLCLTLHVSRNSLPSCFLARSIPGPACGDAVGTTEAPLKPTFLPQKRLYVTPPHLTNAIIRLL